MFFSNTATAFLGFVFTWILARWLTVEEFGVFSAASNLVFILAPLVDIGVTAGLVRFVSQLEAKGKYEESLKYIKAGFIIRASLTLVFAAILVAFAPLISSKFLATNDPMISVWVALILIGIFFVSFFPFLFQARRQFLKSVITDISYTLGRVIIAALFLLVGLTLYNALASFALAGVVTFFVVWILFGYSFLNRKVPSIVYKKLMGFSGWLGVNKILSSIYSRVDILFLASIAGATITGYYSIASRLAFFIIVITSSLSAVMAPRLSAFEDKEKEKVYIKKATLLLVIISAGVLFWVAIARPFIIILFSTKYVESVAIFQALALAMIPFLFTAPPVTAIIYAMKKPKYIGIFSVVQLVLMVVLNYYLITRYGAFGAAFTFGIVNTLLAIYTWTIVIKHYWFTK